MERIRPLLVERGVKQTWLASQLGMDPTLLNKVLLGHRRPRPDFYRSVARALRVRLTDVMPIKEAAPIAPLASINGIEKAATNAESVAA